MRGLDITRWPVVLVFLAAGVAAVVSAFASVNLFGETVANITFLRAYGVEALKLGALMQLAGLVIWGMVALAAFIGFKLCEVELVHRYRSWIGHPLEKPEEHESW